MTPDLYDGGDAVVTLALAALFSLALACGMLSGAYTRRGP